MRAITYGYTYIYVAATVLHILNKYSHRHIKLTIEYSEILLINMLHLLNPVLYTLIFD